MASYGICPGPSLLTEKACPALGPELLPASPEPSWPVSAQQVCDSLRGAQQWEDKMCFLLPGALISASGKSAWGTQGAHPEASAMLQFLDPFLLLKALALRLSR